MNFLPTNITIKGLKINNMDHLSSTSFSSTIKTNRNVCAKKNQGFGQQFSDKTIRAFGIHAANDNDFQDEYAEKINR
ncbi:hypothetical protein [Neobacillus muris]|uniref:hypothetical protein n=1 Tax=Neobacillus muris TaxID=2941334 RepID=UPI00203E540A|nr:hypothetical protein [Neobacillus muris]